MASYDVAKATHTHHTTDITDIGAGVTDFLTAADDAAARQAIGAGTSNLAIGTTASTAKAGNWTDTTRLLVDSEGALTRFRGFVTVQPTNLVAGDFWFLVG